MLIATFLSIKHTTPHEAQAAGGEREGQMADFTTTRDGIIGALTFTPTGPTFLRDVLKMKRERGDNDCDAFRRVAKEFGVGLNATVSGASNAMRQWMAGKKVYFGYSNADERKAFLADLDAVRNGTFGERRAA